MSQRELARRAGVSRQAVGAFESGAYSLRAEVLYRISQALDVPMETFFGCAHPADGECACACVHPPSGGEAPAQPASEVEG